MSSATTASSQQNQPLSKARISLPGEAMSGLTAEGVSPEQADVNGSKRGVSWQDFHGKDLTQVREFEPSEQSDTDDEGVERKPGCCCVVS